MNGGAAPGSAAGGTAAGETRPAGALPHALEPATGVTSWLAGADGRRPLAVFLDFDGTLAPIVVHPERARLGRGVREAVWRLARRALVAVLSGRDLRDVRGRVGLPGVWYAGSHGLEIAAPRGPGLALAVGRGWLPDLDRAEAALREAIGAVPGAGVERKRLAIAVHLRRVAAGDRARVEAAFERVASLHPRLRTTAGKEVRELLPAIAWDKGRAVEWLLASALGGMAAVGTRVPVVIGDDVTDEDAFRAVRGRGPAVVVGAGERPTAATHRLASPEEVPLLLDALARAAERRARGSREGRRP